MALVRSKSVSLGIVCALVLSGCGLLPSISLEPQFQAAALVGADTWSFTDVTMRPSLLQAFRTSEVLDHFAGPASAAGIDVRRLPTPSGRIVDVEKDVLPRLDGEVVVAASGPIRAPQYTVLVHTNDIEGTLRLFAREPQPRFTKDARGVTHYESSEVGAFVAGYKNWIVYATTAALRDQTLDRIDGKGGPSLASDARYRSAIERLSGDRLGFGYANVAHILEQSSFGAPDFFTDTLETSGRLAYSFGFEDGPAAGVHVLGLRIEYMPDTPRGGQSTGAGDALAAMDRLPKATMVAFAGPSFNIYSESLDALSDLTDNKESVAGLRFILAHFAGPHAFGVAAPTTIQPAGLDELAEEDDYANLVSRFLGGVFVIAKVAPDVDSAELADSFTSLADLVAKNEAGDSTWQAEVTFDDDWLAFNAVPAPASLEALPEDLLASDRLYQWTRQGFRQNGANLYVSLDAIQSIIATQLPLSDELATVSLFRAIGLSSEVEDQGDVHAHLTVLIARP